MTVAARESEPRIWMVVGDRLGDNAQVETLVAALGLPVERKYVCVKAPWIKGKPKVIPSLHHLDLARSDALQGPPWPDLVITVGRRLSMVALWIRQQSGERTKLVLVGKPSGSGLPFSLIVTSSEVQLAPAPNVLRISLPLLRVDEDRVSAAADEWRERLAELPRPLIGILVGGPTNPFAYTRGVQDRLIESAQRIAEEGGTPYVTTSPRTPARTVEALRERLPERARFFEWRAGAPDNPYPALLGLADGFVVTGDSLSMLVEVAKSGKPLAIFALPYAWIHRFDKARRVGARKLYAPDEGARWDALRRWIRTLGGWLHILPRTRDFTAIHQLLIERGLAVEAGQPLRESSGEVPNDLPEVVQRIRALVDAA